MKGSLVSFSLILALLLIGCQAQEKIRFPENMKIIDFHNGKITKSNYNFVYEDYKQPQLRILREQEKLDQVVKKAKTEFEKFILLRNWVKSQWVHSIPQPYPPWNALIILDWIRKGKTGGFCAQYAVVYVQACLSLGLQARYIDTNCKRGTGHFLTEVWSNDYNKWVVMDPDFNIHYERNSIPLSALDLHHSWVKNNWQDIEIIQGYPPSKIHHIGDHKYNLIDYYYDISIDLRNNHLSQPNNFWDRKHGYLSWRDEYTQGRPTIYTKFSNRKQDFYWPLNQTVIKLIKTSEPDLLKIDLETFTPNFKTFLTRINHSQWSKTNLPLFWKLRKGSNILEAKSKNKFGISGPTSYIIIDYIGSN